MKLEWAVFGVAIAAGVACSKAPKAASPAPSTLASAPVAVAASTEPASTKEDSPFHVVAVLDAAMMRANEAFVRGIGAQGFIFADESVLRLPADESGELTAASAGLAEAAGDTGWEVSAVGGTWPDAAFAATVTSVVEGTQGAIFRWDGKRWQKVLNTRPRESVLSIEAGADGAVLALVRGDRPLVQASVTRLAGPTKAVLPELTKQAHPVAPYIDRLGVEAFVLLPSGEGLAGGTLWDLTKGDATAVSGGVERFSAGQKKGIVEALPDTADRGFGFVGVALVSATRAHAFGNVDDANHQITPYWATFDGTGWRRAVLPFAQRVLHAWPGPGETAWIATTDALWRYAAGAWSRVALPTTWPDTADDEKGEIESLWASPSGDVWAIAASKTSRWLLHTGEAKAKLRHIAW